MTLANDSILVTPGSGATYALHTVSSKGHPLLEVADEAGHLVGSKPTYLYVTDTLNTTVNKLDIFNATGSGFKMRVFDLRWISKLDVAVVGTLANRIDIYRTSAVGTGGSTASKDSATIDVAGGNFIKLDESNTALPAGITARTFPTGGATKTRWLRRFDFCVEEFGTAGATFSYFHQYQNQLPLYDNLSLHGQSIVVPENSGLKVEESSTVNSVGHILIAFTLE